MPIYARVVSKFQGSSSHSRGVKRVHTDRIWLIWHIELSAFPFTYILPAGYGGRLVVQVTLSARMATHLHEELLHAQTLLRHDLRRACLGGNHRALYLNDSLTLDLEEQQEQKIG